MADINPRGLRRRLVAASVAGRYDLFLGIGGGLAVLGLILFLRALGSADGGIRAWQLFHVNWLYFTSLSAGLVAFAAVMKVTNARWSGLVIRFAEAAWSFFVVALIGTVLIFTAGYHAIFGPMQAQLGTLSPGKQLWLSHGFMFARIFIGLLLLAWLGARLVRVDMIPDMFAARDAVTGSRRRRFERLTAGYDGSEGRFEWVERQVRYSGPQYVVLYAAVMTLVAFDCIMALQPHWYSNLLGGWFFMGAFLNAHSWLALLMIFGGAQLGIRDLISPKQRHDLGKLHFGFTVFWAYLMWAQFLVIWYGNMPEETGFVFARLWGPWLPIGSAVFIGVFVIPFIGLLGVAPKKNRFTLGLFATISLVSMWLERYMLVLPSVTPLPGPVIGIPEIGPTLLFLGLFLLTYGLFARSFPMVSPRLAEITLGRELSHHGVEVFDFEDTDKDYVHETDLERRKGPR